MPAIVPKLAEELLDATTIVGSSPTGKPIIRLKPGSPPWMQKIVADAHLNTPPDSSVYRVIEIAADIIMDGGHEWEIRDRLTEIEPMQDVGDLEEWLESNRRNRAYANMAVQLYNAETHEDALSIGQKIWIDEITEAVFEGLIEAGKKEAPMYKPRFRRGA